jgi:hypothetical protein
MLVIPRGSHRWLFRCPTPQRFLADDLVLSNDSGAIQTELLASSSTINSDDASGLGFWRARHCLPSAVSGGVRQESNLHPADP